MGHLCTSAQLGTSEIVEYLQGQLVGKLDIKEGYVIDFILRDKIMEADYIIAIIIQLNKLVAGIVILTAILPGQG